MQLRAAYVTAFAESISKVIDNMGEVRPTFFAAVPRIYEKLYGPYRKLCADLNLRNVMHELALASFA